MALPTGLLQSNVQCYEGATAADTSTEWRMGGGGGVVRECGEGAW